MHVNYTQKIAARKGKKSSAYIHADKAGKYQILYTE